jgi:DNA-binding transcriptional LysR family regulator
VARSYGHLNELELFLKVAECRSFSTAAEQLGLTPSALSRSVARLEDHVGVRLLSRTTRQVALTEDGVSYATRARQALELVREAELALAGKQSAPRGRLRISAPTTYGHHRLLPAVVEYLERFPAVEIEVNLSNRNIDFVSEGYDLAIRLGPPKDSRLIARALEDVRVGVYGAPSYLKRHGTPRRVTDLERHRCIPFLMPSTGRPLPWLFRVDGEDVEWHPPLALCCSDDVLGCVTLAHHGAGLVHTMAFVVADAIARGELVEVLKATGGRTRTFSVLYPRQHHLSAAVRTFVGFLLDRFTPSARLVRGN